MIDLNLKMRHSPHLWKAFSQTEEETKFDVDIFQLKHRLLMNTFPTVNSTDFHMTNYDSSIYSEIEQFCKENEFTVDYFQVNLLKEATLQHLSHGVAWWFKRRPMPLVKLSH